MQPIRALSEASYSIRGITRVGTFLVLIGMVVAGAVSTLLLLREEEAEAGDLDPIHELYAQFESYGCGACPDCAELQENGGRLEGPLGRIFIGPEEDWLPVLAGLVNQEPPPPGARFALGLWQTREGKTGEALDLFHAENAEYPHEDVRLEELYTAAEAGDIATIRSLEQDPAYRELMDAGFRVHLGVEMDDWGLILRNILPAEYGNLWMPPLMLSLVAGAIWGLLVLSLLPARPTLAQGFLGAAAFSLGWMSTWPTILSGMWMDLTFRLNEGTDFFSALYYYVVSVGLREEVSKLLLFTPLLLRTARRGRDLEALLFGALVGLGFAIEENISYVATGFDGVAVSRFVSANLLHLTLTGATALALNRAVRNPRHWGAEAGVVLLMAIGLHGLYNTLLSEPVPGLGDMSYFSGSALAGCAFLFFRDLTELAPLRRRSFTRTALFCWGFCLLFSLELGWAAAHVPFDAALYATGQAALAGVFTGYIFVYCVREPLA